MSEHHFKRYVCLLCGWTYDEAKGDAEHNLAPGTKWADISDEWTCPECGAHKDDFRMVETN